MNASIRERMLHNHSTTDYAFWGPLDKGECTACDWEVERGRIDQIRALVRD